MTRDALSWLKLAAMSALKDLVCACQQRGATAELVLVWVICFRVSLSTRPLVLRRESAFRRRNLDGVSDIRAPPPQAAR